MRIISTGLFSIAFLLLCKAAIAQEIAPAPYIPNSRVNYIRTWDAASPVQDPEVLKALPVDASRQSTQYLDGLGRPIQTVIKQITPSRKDLVSPVTYDELGRETLKYLSFSSSIVQTNMDVANDGNFKMDPFWQDSAFALRQYPGETFYYGKTLQERSPLARPIQGFAQGNSWVGGGRGSSFKYEFNTLLDSVRVWTIANLTGGLPASTATYGAGLLQKTTTTDEAGHFVVEYKNVSGQVLLKKVQLVTTPSVGHWGWLNTYYVYDNLNNLRFVISPKGVDAIVSNWIIPQGIADELCFRYEYDKRGRMIIKKIPGAGEVWMVYDMRDRIVMTQDANLRPAKWLVTVYDSLNRVVRTGLLTNSNDRVYHQAAAYRVINYPSTATGFELLTRNYYDDYGWVSTSGNGLPAVIDSTDFSNSNYFNTSYNSAPDYAVRMSRSTHTRGLLTGTQTEILSSVNTYLYSVSFYDDHSRIIQTVQTNETGARDTLSMQYEFTGKVLRSYLKHLKGKNTVQSHSVLTKMEYDHGDRLKRIWKNIDHATVFQLIDSMRYDELGQLQTKYLGDRTDSLAYGYNIRGWLTTINKNFITGSATGNFFGMELAYDRSASITGASYGAALYNGNIAGTIWKTAGDGIKRKYDFTYDNVNRLAAAGFTQNTTGAWDQALDFSVSNLSYDQNGNILSMNQKGIKVTGPFTMDALTYSYQPNSNKLSQVNDGANDAASKLGDFHYSGTKLSSDYSYDNNGNLITDNNKSITGIVYNYLNLPQQISISSNKTIKYNYDAAGNKLSKVTIDASLSPSRITTTRYIGGFVYKSDSVSGGTQSIDTLQFISHEEGRVRWAFHKYKTSTAYGFEYDFFEKDHLGNTRVILTKQKDTACYLASMEGYLRNTETLLFNNIATTSYAKNLVPGTYPTDNTTTPNDSVARVNGSTNRVGPSIIIKVMAGDTLSFATKSYYISKTGTTTSTSVVDILASFASGIVGATGGSKGSYTELIQSNGPLDAALSSFISTYNTSQPADKPNAFLNWISLDDQLKYVGGSQSGAIPVGYYASATLGTPGVTQLVVSKSGFIYIYVNNQSQNWDVFFDNLSIMHKTGPLLEETHYYPFGLTMAGISSKALKANYAQNNFKYNGKELQSQEFADGSGLDGYDYGARMYDPQIGRFNGVDALATKYLEISPYCYVANNPTNAIDIDGKRIIYVNGYWNRILNKIGAAPNSGGRGYWQYFSGTFLGNSRSFMGVQNYESDVFVDGSSLFGGDMSGGDRYGAGRRYADENYKDLVKGLKKGETFKFVSHSEGGAFAAGMASYLMDMGQTVESMLYLSPDEADEFSSPIGTFSMQAHYDKDIVSPSMKLGGVDVYANFNYMDGKEVGKMAAHGSSPTSNTLTKLGDAMNVLHKMAGDSFMTKMFDVKGQWTVTETANGYTFTRADAVLPDENKK